MEERRSSGLRAHTARVHALQDEFLADDLEPPLDAADWPECRLRSWFEHAGAPSQELTRFLAGLDLTPDAFLCHGICSIDDLTDSLKRLRAKDLGISVGSHARLQAASLAEEKSRAIEKAEHAARAAKIAKDLEFRIQVEARAALGNAAVFHEDSSGFTVDPPPLPSGGFIEVGVTAELGGYVWPCAALLAHHLRNHAIQVRGACAIELGAGTGYTGLYAAGLGARQLLLTDVFHTSDAAVNKLQALLQANIERNRGMCSAAGCASMATNELNFALPAHADANAKLADGGGGFELVLASDVTYQGIGVNFGELSRVIATVMHRDGCALIAHECRRVGARLAPDGGDPALVTLRREAEAAGLTWEMVHDDRGRHVFARTGMRCIIRLTHGGEELAEQRPAERCGQGGGVSHSAVPSPPPSPPPSHPPSHPPSRLNRRLTAKQPGGGALCV